MAFAPNPHIVFVDHLEELPLADFVALPDHPAQRQTAIHAVSLIAAGVLNEALDQHREVEIILIGDPEGGDTIEKMLELYRRDPAAAFQRYGHKQNGHTRVYCWTTIEGLPVPETVRATVYAARDVAAATKSYNAVDSGSSVKGLKDMTQTTVHIAQLTPVSEWLKRASGLTNVLSMAQHVVCGGSFVPGDLRKVLLDQLQPTALEKSLHEALPHLAAVQYFKPALELLDSLEPSSAMMPVSAPYMAGYLSLLHRDPQRGKAFLEALQSEHGEYTGGLMDAFYCIKKVGDRVFDEREKMKTTPGQRNRMVLSCVLNAYEGWNGDSDNFKADKYPTETRVLASFNPDLHGAVTSVMKARQRAEMKAKQRQVADRRQAKLPVVAQLPIILPQGPGDAFQPGA